MVLFYVDTMGLAHVSVTEPKSFVAIFDKELVAFFQVFKQPNIQI